jgi:hypothetical protein
MCPVRGQAIPGAGLDEQIGELLIATLTPLAIEAALTVTAELQQRAAALRAAHVERARYHADLARRRYLAVDPANRLVADTLEADWNTALRVHRDARDTYDQARKKSTGHLTDAKKTRIRQLGTDLPAIWDDPATSARERKRITRLLLTDVTVHDGPPERGGLAGGGDLQRRLGQPDAQHVLLPVAVDAHGDVGGLVADHDRVQEHRRVHLIQRPVLPGADLLQHAVGDPRDGLVRTGREQCSGRSE